MASVVLRGVAGSLLQMQQNLGWEESFVEIVPFTILWSIWGERNDGIFRGSSSSLANVIPKLALRIAKWALARKEFSNLTINDILFYWESCMGCGLIKERRLILCSAPPSWVLKYDVDGVREVS